MFGAAQFSILFCFVYLAEALAGGELLPFPPPFWLNAERHDEPHRLFFCPSASIELVRTAALRYSPVATRKMLRRASAAVVGRARVAVRAVHTETKLKEMGIELPTPKAPLGT